MVVDASVNFNKFKLDVVDLDRHLTTNKIERIGMCSKTQIYVHMQSSSLRNQWKYVAHSCG